MENLLKLISTKVLIEELRSRKNIGVRKIHAGDSLKIEVQEDYIAIIMPAREDITPRIITAEMSEEEKAKFNKRLGI